MLGQIVIYAVATYLVMLEIYHQDGGVYRECVITKFVPKLVILFSINP